LDDKAGILDDLMITHAGDHLFVVVNAANKGADVAHLRRHLTGVGIDYLEDRALLALQGPVAAAVMGKIAPDALTLTFLSGAAVAVGGIPCFVTRSGYTGEDGFEISVPAGEAEALARTLLADPAVKPIGLGARDSLRLEAGLCLHGQDIDPSTTPIEADLAWAISKRRRTEGGFPGAAIVRRQLAEGPTRRRVGIKPEDKAPARAHTDLTDAAGSKVGEITSGGFGPTVGGPIAMGYVATALAHPGTELKAVVRGTPRPARVAPLPFAPHRYHRS
jgi:aminomethyltransferase